MKRLVLTFVSTAAVCSAVLATPVVAQESIMGAPRGETPVTVEGYGNSSGYTSPSASNSGPAFAIQLPGMPAPGGRCQVTRDFYGLSGRLTSVCGP
jgi:hypothetical protein